MSAQKLLTGTIYKKILMTGSAVGACLVVSAVILIYK